jgi:imidazolonepropionase-like amidohydrolase
VREGADAIKLVASGGGTHGTVAYRPSFSVEELSAAVEAAHDAGLPTAAHCHAVTGIERAAVAGVDCLEHVSFLVEPAGGAAAQRFGSAWSGYAAAYDPRVVERIAEAGCLISCTLLGGSHAVRELRAREAAGAVLDEADRRRLAASREHVERKLSIFSALVRDGLLGRIVISTDAGPGDTRFGELHHALALAVEAGVTPVQAIEAATRIAAEACRLDRTTGTLEPGKDADVLVVAGNAGRDIAALDDVVAVLRRGVERTA